MRTLTLTVPREDAWCFEQAKVLARHVQHMGNGSNSEVMFGLVAESTSTLCNELPSTAIALPDDDATDPERTWRRELARMRADSEVRCETNFRHRRSDEPRQSRESNGRMSLSSIKARRHLVKRLGQLRFLADALDRGELGYEAARLVAGVATCATVESWVVRARERTLRHLREEIDAAEVLARWSESSTVVPPSDAGVHHVEQLERAVITGQISAPPVSPPAATAPPAHITLRLRVHASTARDYRHWEAIYLRHRSTALRNTTFLRFASELFTDTWRPRASEVEYAHIYERDRRCCQSPCCTRRDVTPHHLRFRSRGGDDSDENVTSLCTWCHLKGIHGGQISASPPASNIRWTFGRSGHTVVEGRRRVPRSRVGSLRPAPAALHAIE